MAGVLKSSGHGTKPHQGRKKQGTFLVITLARVKTGLWAIIPMLGTTEAADTLAW